MASATVTAEDIHPSLWRASLLARGRGRVVDTGYPALSAELPGGGWPVGALIDPLSFAAINDEPPPEIAAAGHDRCIIPIKPENIDAWLNPDPSDLKA